MTEQPVWRGGRRWADPSRARRAGSTVGRRWSEPAWAELGVSSGLLSPPGVIVPIPGDSGEVAPVSPPPEAFAEREEPSPVAEPAAPRHQAAASALRGMFTRDFLYVAVSALQVILATAVTPILTRRVTPIGYGQLALAVTVLQILGPVFSFGLPFAAQKLFAGEDGERWARGVLAVSTALALVACVVIVLAAPLWGPAIGLYSTADARLAAIWGGLFAVTWTCLAMLRSKESLGVAIFVGALQSLGAQAAGVALLYLSSRTVSSYLTGAIIGQAAAALVGLVVLRPDWLALGAIRRFGRALVFGLPMVPQQLSVFVLYAGDRIVIRHDVGSAATGRYSVAYNVGCLGVLLLVFVNQAWLPRIYAIADRAARSRLLASSRDMMNLLLIPVVCGLAAAAPVVLRLWAPPSFDPTGLTPIVAIVALSTFPYSQFLSNVRALMSEGKTSRAAITTAVGAVVNVGLNIALVPPFGITGSAIATVLSYALLAQLTRPPESSGLRVPTSPRLTALIVGAIGVTLAMGVLPTSPIWVAIRLCAAVAAAGVFVALLRNAVSGPEPSGRLVSLVGAGVGEQGV